MSISISHPDSIRAFLEEEMRTGGDASLDACAARLLQRAKQTKPPRREFRVDGRTYRLTRPATPKRISGGVGASWSTQLPRWQSVFPRRGFTAVTRIGNDAVASPLSTTQQPAQPTILRHSGTPPAPGPRPRLTGTVPQGASQDNG